MNILRLNKLFSDRVRLLCYYFLLVCFMVAPVHGETIIEGDVSGNWDIENSPYIVVGDIVVTQEGLTIESGVQVLFRDYYTFEVQGQLTAISQAPDERIYFGSTDFTLWHGIIFTRSAQLSRLINCDIENVWVGVNCIESSLEISGCSIDAQNIAINCDNSSPRIHDNYLIRVLGESEDHSRYCAINLTNGSSPIILDNQLIQCDVNIYSDAYGILSRDYSDAIISRNRIETRSSGLAHAIDVGQVNNFSISFNIIEVYSSQSMIGIYTEDATGVDIHRNTLVMDDLSGSMAIGIEVGISSRVSIINNIIVGNGNSIGISNIHGGEILEGSGYNDLFNHLPNREMDGYWPEFAFAHNINADPLFVDDDGEYHLYMDVSIENWDDEYQQRKEEGSPCIDAGNPDVTWLDPDSSCSDIGRWYKDHPRIPDPVSVEIDPVVEEYEIVSLYPNPFNANTRLIFNTKVDEQVEITIYDLNGRLVQNVLDRAVIAGKHDISISFTNQTPGVYILKLDKPSASIYRKLIYLP